MRTRLLGLGLLVATLVTSCQSSQPDPRERDFTRLEDQVGGAVAVEAPEDLTYLASRLSADELAELRELAPNVTFRVGLRGAELLEAARSAQGMDAHLLTGELAEAADQLAWVQAWSAGVDRYVADALWQRPDAPLLTNMAGVHGPAIADHALAMLLSLVRRLDTWRSAMREPAWDRGRATGMSSLHGKTMVVVGMGGIGREIARRAKGFDMRVLATVRTAREAPWFVDELGVAADLERFLGEADVIAIALPLTDATRGLFGEHTLSLTKRGAILVNIARGPIVDTDALLAALESGQLAGACLDVTDPEPLPLEHPLWAREDVLITPHVAGRAEVTSDRRWALFRENARRFARGLPLINVVDVERGY